jgi:copper oxidase (laccase) domain-containing protein
LAQLGVAAIHQSPDCSYRDQDRYFSHRRDAGATGRFASLVWIA